MSDDVAAFLAARLDEVEASLKWDIAEVRDEGPQLLPHTTYHAERLLRQVEADRRLLAEVDKLAGDTGWDDAIMLAVKIRAAVFSDHPDYQARWKP